MEIFPLDSELSGQFFKNDKALIYVIFLYVKLFNNQRRLNVANAKPIYDDLKQRFSKAGSSNNGTPSSE